MDQFCTVRAPEPPIPEQSYSEKPAGWTEEKQTKHVKRVHAPAQRFPQGYVEIYETCV